LLTDLEDLFVSGEPVIFGGKWQETFGAIRPGGAAVQRVVLWLCVMFAFGGIRLGIRFVRRGSDSSSASSLPA
jgi:hypothetical protein